MCVGGVGGCCFFSCGGFFFREVSRHRGEQKKRVTILEEIRNK